MCLRAYCVNPYVALSPSTASVGNEQPTYSIYLTNNAEVVGRINWSNGSWDAGTWSATSRWWYFSVKLGPGANTIVAIGTNTAGLASTNSAVVTRSTSMQYPAFQGLGTVTGIVNLTWIKIAFGSPNSPNLDTNATAILPMDVNEIEISTTAEGPTNVLYYATSTNESYSSSVVRPDGKSISITCALHPASVDYYASPKCIELPLTHIFLKGSCTGVTYQVTGKDSK